MLQIRSEESPTSSLSEDTSFAIRNENEGGNSQCVKPKKLKKNSSEDLLAQAAKVLNEPTDDLSVFGQYVATELRSIRSDILRRKTKRDITLAIMQAQKKDEQQLSFRSQNTSSVFSGCTSSTPVTYLEEFNEARIFNAGTPAADVSSFNINAIVDESVKNPVYHTLTPPFKES